MKQVTEAITAFLRAQEETHPGRDLLERYLEYGIDLETQVNVMAGQDGEPVAGKRSTWTDGVNEWWNIRIPKQADSDPKFKDYLLSWPLEEHAEGIGSTGWDWKNRVSRWVGFDFDHLVDHAEGVGISDTELRKIQKVCEEIPWVEVRKSTGGKGIHLYVMLDAIPTNNHNEHAALARCILEKMSTEAGYNFANSIDCCGSVLWIWHRKLAKSDNGLALIKSAELSLGESDLPPNWRDHVEVVTRRRAKVAVSGINEKDTDEFEMLASARPVAVLDKEHNQVIEELTYSGFSTVWIQDYQLLQTHTVALQQVHQEKKLKGIFKTNSEGQDKATPNCFMFPLPNGAWKVYRFGKGVSENKTWSQDGEGWTSCYFNQVVSLETVCKYYGGVRTGQGYIFKSLKEGLEVLEATGIEIETHEEFLDRKCEILTNYKGTSLVKIDRQKDEPEPGPQWVDSRGDKWACYLDENSIKEEATGLQIDEIDTKIRCVVDINGKLVDWFICNNKHEWNQHPRTECIGAICQNRGEIQKVMNYCVLNPFKEVCVPFQSEYPGDRQWNRKAPQFKYVPKEGKHPHWDLILKQCFDDLTETLKALPWAIENNIRTGAQYGLAWLSSCFQLPYEKLPYLFFFGGQAGGKSTFHEAIMDLVTNNGVIKGEGAIINKHVTNGDLEKAVIAIIDEKNLAGNKDVYDDIKRLVTEKTIRIRRLYHEAYAVPSTLHFMHTANSLEHCPVFEGDTRITVIEVKGLQNSEIINDMNKKLEEEAPAFIYTLLHTELPPPADRFRIPNIETPNKWKAIQAHQGDLSYYLDEFYEETSGARIRFSTFYDEFRIWIAKSGGEIWPRNKVSREINKTLKYQTSIVGGSTYVMNMKKKETNGD